MHRTSSSEIKHAVLLSAWECEPGRRRRAISAQENKALVRREQKELWNHTGELDAADELFAADQAEAAKSTSQHIFRRDFPDVLSTIEDIIAEGRQGGCSLQEPSHQGEYMGTPASSKEVQLTGISIYHIEGGKIAQEWSVEDECGLRWLRSARLLRPSNSSSSSSSSSHTTAFCPRWRLPFTS